MATALRPAMFAGDWLARGEAFLIQAGVPEAAANAEFLLADVLGCGRAKTCASSDRPLTERQSQRFLRLLKQRARRIPLAYVLGTQPFLDLEFRATPAALIPRPETEQLASGVVEIARKYFPRGTALHILEIGAGTGCISIALARRLPEAVLYATDISAAALRLAKDNARRHRVEERIRFLNEDLFKPDAAVSGAWADILVSNPPYIASGDIPRLEPEVLKEPVLALDGGKDGLNAIRAIVADAPGRLKPRGWLALEIGDGQAETVRGLLGEFKRFEIRKDMEGRERFILAQAI